MFLGRRFLVTFFLAAVLGVVFDGGGRVLGGDESAVKLKPDVVIFEGQYPGWPWITAGGDGTLYCVFREGTRHGYSASGKAMFSKSSDHGKTWSKAEVIVDTPEVDDRNVAIVELRNKDLLVCYNTYTEPKESLAMTIRSTDGGRSWGKPQPVGRANTRTRAAVVTLSNGHLVLPYYVAPGNGALAGLSKDNGQSWRTVAIPDAAGFIGDEWDVLEVEAGRLIGIIRNSHPKPAESGTFWMTESRDGGATWSVPLATNIRDRASRSPAQITRQGGAVMVLFADRRMISVSAVSGPDADYVKWDIEHRHLCYFYNADESRIQDGSYPVSAAVGADRKLIVDYEIREKSKRIVGYFVDFPRIQKEGGAGF